MVKEFLSQRGVAVEERDVAQNATYARELEGMGQRGVPVTIIDGQMVIGYDRARLENLLSGMGQRPAFGAAIADAGRMAAGPGGAVTLGAYIGRVRAGSSAEKAGLVAGDIITEFNMKPIARAGDLEAVLAGMNQGNRFSLVFLRGGRTMSAEGSL